MTQKQYKTIIKTIFFLIFAIVTNVKAIIFITPKAPDISAYSYVLMDYNSQKIITANKEHSRREPASLSKLMTAYVAFQLIKDGRINLADKVKISKNAWQTEGSKSFIKVGDNISLEVLLKAMIVQSGNDAAVAIAEYIAGSEGTFAAYMNSYAKELNMKNTNFENSSGLPHKNQYTSAFDMAILSIQTIKNFPKLYLLYKQKQFTYNNITQYNRNKLLWYDKTIDGLKTGFTKKAGYCLAVSAERRGMRLISVILGSNSEASRITETEATLNYGFRFFETTNISNVEIEVPIFKSLKDTIKVGFIKPTYVTLLRDKFKLSKQTAKLNSELAAPIKTGDIMGKFLLTFNNDTIAEFPLVALEDAKQAGIIKTTIDSIKIYFNQYFN